MSAKSIFKQVVCLTLPGQRNRHLSAAKAFQSIGIENYEFYPGFDSNSPDVKKAYCSGSVKRYPNCFRCGQRDCGDPNCNNVLIPSQVAVALGFRSIFKYVMKSQQPFTLVCEDDIFFAGYAKSIIESSEFIRLISESGLPSTHPTLIRLGRPSFNHEHFFSPKPPSALTLESHVVMSNYAFLVNPAFAQLAYSRLASIDHTADVIIHRDLVSTAQCWTLEPQLVADRSWSLGDMPSLIHPKQKHVEYLTCEHGVEAEETQSESIRLKQHRKKALSRSYGLIGSPRCGSHYVSVYLCRHGIEVPHERLGADGITAWQYTVSSTAYPYITDPAAQSDFFLHIDHWYIYTRHPYSAIPSLIIENQKAPLSYAFRREAIARELAINLDNFTNPIERAARSYLHWYELALKRTYRGILRVERLQEDLCAHFPNRVFNSVEINDEERGVGKPYLRYRHQPAPLPTDWINVISSETKERLKYVVEALGYTL